MISVARGGAVLGEFTEDDFRIHRSTGAILPNDCYWTDGMSEWRAVSEWRAPSPMIVAAVKSKKKRNFVLLKIIGCLAGFFLLCYMANQGAEQNDIRAAQRGAALHKEIVKAIAARQVLIGMTADQIRQAWGNPRKINRTVWSDHDREQWIYGSEFGHETYLYVEDGVLTSFQD